MKLKTIMGYGAVTLTLAVIVFLVLVQTVGLD